MDIKGLPTDELFLIVRNSLSSLEDSPDSGAVFEAEEALAELERRMNSSMR